MDLTQVKEQIDKDVKNHKVVLFMKGEKTSPLCGFSAQVVNILTDLGAEYESRNVLADEALRQGIKEYTNWPTIPQLYINAEFIGGCDIVTELYQNGELKKLIS